MLLCGGSCLRTLRFGGADGDPPTPQTDLAKPLPSNSLSEALDADADVGADGKAGAAGADAYSKMTLRTPVMLAFCKKSWPSQINGTDKTVHVRGV